ncbi:MAG: hypothetical protein ACMZ63_06965 [Methylotenera sp.]|jgi:hypothetical protein
MLHSALERDANNRAFEKEVRKFGEILKDDDAMLAKLEATSDADSFIAAYVNMAAQKGIHFTADDMKIVVQEQKTGHDWLIPKVVLMMVRERF